jgi:hypothetical protein
MDVPDAIADFLDEAVVLDNVFLPQCYADGDDVAAFQDAFRDDRGWLESWCALGHNHQAEPFFVDCDEAPDFPVYFAYRGSGRWDPVAVADTLADFAYLLGRLQDLEADPREAAQWLEAKVDLDNEVWGDIWSFYTGDAGRLEAPAKSVPINPNDYVYGHAVVTDLGDDAPAVLAALSQAVGRPTAALAEEDDIALGHDRFINLRETIDRLTALGATVVFEEDA